MKLGRVLHLPSVAVGTSAKTVFAATLLVGVTTAATATVIVIGSNAVAPPRGDNAGAGAQQFSATTNPGSTPLIVVPRRESAAPSPSAPPSTPSATPLPSALLPFTHPSSAPPPSAQSPAPPAPAPAPGVVNIDFSKPLAMPTAVSTTTSTPAPTASPAPVPTPTPRSTPAPTPTRASTSTSHVSVGAKALTSSSESSDRDDVLKLRSSKASGKPADDDAKKAKGRHSTKAKDAGEKQPAKASKHEPPKLEHDGAKNRVD